MDFEKVVSEGLCVGCGVCAMSKDSGIAMQRTKSQTYLPDLTQATEQDLALGNRICPFSDASPDETVLSDQVFGASEISKSKDIGYHDSLLAGRIANDENVIKSSSGGLTSWFTLELLERGIVDGVIHVGYAHSGPALFEFTLSYTPEDIQERRKSQYYAVEFSQVIAKIRGDGKRYAFVGVPCFVKALRTVTQEDPALKMQITWFIGLVCGHLKSGAFPEVLADQVGVERPDLSRVDFRVKNEDKPSNEYSFGALAKSDGVWRKSVSRDLIGGNWGHALFQLKSCDFCDDIFAETADVCFGDAWLPKYKKEWRGTNLVVSRRAEASEIFSDAMKSGAIDGDLLTQDEVIATQAGNFRHRRDGLAYRLHLSKRRGRAVPKKRVSPSRSHLSLARKMIVRLREAMAQRSHSAYLEAQEQNDMGLFYKVMGRYIFLLKVATKLDSKLPKKQ